MYSLKSPLRLCLKLYHSPNETCADIDTEISIVDTVMKANSDHDLKLTNGEPSCVKTVTILRQAANHDQIDDRQ